MSLSTRRLRKLQLPTCAPCCCRTSFATGEESTSPNGRTSITPDVYLKVCEQSRPTINADFILFDEAQDSDGLMLSVLKHQRTQVIYVGDPYQQNEMSASHLPQHSAVMELKKISQRDRA